MDAIVRAHFGQAIDVGTPIDALPQEKVWETCLASLEWKTGALMGLAASLGAALAGADEKTLSQLRDFGVAFGIALQMFDDIGNLGAGKGTLPDPKQYEDLRLRRPSWIWACAAHSSSPEDYARFIEAVRRLPDPSWVEMWLDAQALPVRAKAMAVENLDQAFGPLEERLRADERVQWIRELSDRLRTVYG
jgi:geranylgeranyl pyrophosphate synthase